MLDANASAMRVDVGSLTLHVERHGSGTPVLVLHGFAGSARTMRPLIEALAARHRVIAPDLPGHGLSDAPRETSAYAWPAVTRYLVRLLDALDVPHAHVLGFSLGGRVALQLAARRPERVRTVCTIGSRCVWTDPDERSARRTKDAALAARIATEGMRAFVLNIDDAHAAHGVNDDALAAAAPRAGTHGLALALRALGAADQPDMGTELAMSAVPLLLLAGADDQGPLAAARALAADLPAARAAEITGAGHRAHLERTHEVAQLALDFFASADDYVTSDEHGMQPRTRHAARRRCRGRPTMVNVTIDDGKLVLTLEGLDKLWAMKSHLAIPLGNVSAVRADPKIASEKGRTGLKLTGARLGERLIAGSFRQDGQTVFWDVHDGANAIVLDLHDEHYAQLIVEVEDPAATVAQIQAALGKR